MSRFLRFFSRLWFLSTPRIGCDVVEIERIQRLIERYGDRFFEKILTQKEKAYCLRAASPAPCLAGRFAAKEALSKALGCGIGPALSWHDMEILPNTLGSPYATLSPRAAAHFHYPIFSLSISHSKTVAMATALIV